MAPDKKGIEIFCGGTTYNFGKGFLRIVKLTFLFTILKNPLPKLTKNGFCCLRKIIVFQSKTKKQMREEKIYHAGNF